MLRATSVEGHLLAGHLSEWRHWVLIDGILGDVLKALLDVHGLGAWLGVDLSVHLAQGVWGFNAKDVLLVGNAGQVRVLSA